MPEILKKDGILESNFSEENIPIIPRRWSHDYEEHYNNDQDGIKEIIGEINEDIYDEFYRLIFGAPVIGTIIEIINNS